MIAATCGVLLVFIMFSCNVNHIMVTHELDALAYFAQFQWLFCGTVFGRTLVCVVFCFIATTLHHG